MCQEKKEKRAKVKISAMLLGKRMLKVGGSILLIELPINLTML